MKFLVIAVPVCVLLSTGCEDPCGCGSDVPDSGISGGDDGRDEDDGPDAGAGEAADDSLPGGDASVETLGSPDVMPVSDGDWYRPTADSTWQWQLLGDVNDGYDVDVYDVDLFDTPKETIEALQAGGRKVICYFSAGSSEDWRPDFDRFREADMGGPLDDWEGERWVDVRSQNVFSITLARLDLAVEKQCDGVEPDNMDAYLNESGFDLRADDQLAFNRHVANAAHRRGLAAALKNDGDEIPELVDYYDLSVNEQCHEYEECEPYQEFVAEDKPVFNAEYREDYVEDEDARDALCADATSENIRTLVLPLDLDDSFRFSCD